MEHASSKIVTTFDGHKKLASYNAVQGCVVIQSIREEEEYMQHLDKIIQRDYFPDLAGTQESGTGIVNSDTSVPDTWRENESRNPEKGLFSFLSYSNIQILLADPTAVTLDKYLANNTTEDDASFVELIEETEKKQRIKLSSFFPSLEAPSDLVTNEPKPLALPDGAHFQVGPRLTLTGNNAVHFNPDGVAQTQDEFLDHLARERKIVPANTRFKRPLSVTMAKRTLSKQMLLQRIGLDGKELNPALGTPQVGGFKFMDTSPSPALSALGASPLMTWGQLDSTPARLDDGSATPSVMSGVPAFHIPSPSKREQLAHKLADKASRQRTRDRNEAVKRVHSGISSPSLSLLSPAARRLLATSSGRAGSSSRPGTGSSAISFIQSPMAKSFTPRRLASDLVVVRRPTSGRTTGVCQSPAVAADTAKKIPPTHSDESVALKVISPSNEGSRPPNQSITDNLLNLRPQTLHSQTPTHNG
ncbi:hypothetical protein T265_00342 [Opisthorchis viverrini]|uniref:Protein DGCR14 n=1 Tax=Opisthorchis viverrini TaxID=6198 RepID=A0A075ACX8_OPIVI|nr:hypothetical protein T265_00342 [Opisthorchis viverrini]KER33900.1 hypothetical protein T265_00342 [Opisthorchis viverrini]